MGLAQWDVRSSNANTLRGVGVLSQVANGIHKTMAKCGLGPLRAAQFECERVLWFECEPCRSNGTTPAEGWQFECECLKYLVKVRIVLPWCLDR